MRPRHEIYLRSAVRRWKQELENAHNSVLVFSPYLTSNTAERVLRSTRPETCEVYTLFSAEHFATGGSSIRTLRILSDDGFALFDLPGLHAKIVLVCGRCATIGSQNLTRGGTTNREASVILTDPARVAELETELRSWISKRRRITGEMISDMELLLPKLVQKFRSFRREAAVGDRAIEISDRQRHCDRLRRFQARLAAVPRAQEEAVARVCRIEREGWLFHFSNGIQTLLAKPQDNLTRWSVGGRVVNLEPMTRYMCLIEDNGRFGWARVCKTRITFIANGISGLKVSLGNVECRLEVDALWEETNSGQNLRVRLSLQNSLDALDITAWFDIDALSISRIKASRRSAALGRLKEWIDDHTQEFSGLIISHLVKPFHYEHNRLGVNATTFFGPIGTRVRLRTGTIDGNPVLQAKKV